ncbi:MAG: ROK family protein [Myxococcota bacterium]
MSHFLGIDVGGTKVALALGDEQGRVLARVRRPTEPSGNPQADLERLVADGRALLAQAGLGAGSLAAAGVSLPGPLDPESGVLHSPPNLPGWAEVQVRAPLEAGLGCPVHLDNDANAAALAEWRFGAGRGASHLAYLTMSTGVGGGLVLNGRIYRGVHCGAGEIGHVPVEWDGELCSCGLRGCLEAYVGGAAWTRRLARITPPESRAAQLAGAPEAVRPEHLLEAARRGDAFARAELTRWVDYLARGLVVVVFSLAPEVVVLGTIASAAGEELCFAPLRRQVAERTWPHVSSELRILPAALGDELPYLAGLSVALAGSSSS